MTGTVADAPGRCPTDCDDDCAAACHEGHAVGWKRGHEPADCPSATVPPETADGGESQQLLDALAEVRGLHQVIARQAQIDGRDEQAWADLTAERDRLRRELAHTTRNGSCGEHLRGLRTRCPSFATCTLPHGHQGRHHDEHIGTQWGGHLSDATDQDLVDEHGDGRDAP